MKKIRKTLCLALALSFLLCASVTAEAAEARASLYLNAYFAYVYPEGNGKVSVWYDVIATRTMDEVGVLTIRLQEQAPDSTKWTTVETYFHTDYPDMLGSDVRHYDSHVDYEGEEGYSYRAYVTVWAGDDGDGDSRIILTDEVTAT